MTTQGRVVAVSLSPKHGFSKDRHAAIRLIEGLGIEGDAHLGTTTQHLYRKRINPDQPNLCQVHLLHEEVFDELAARGYAIEAGQLGENILTRGLDLLGLPRGARLRIGDTAIVEITGLRNPCQQINRFRAGLMDALIDRDAKGETVRKAGIMGIVASGGFVRADDRIEVDLPAPPFRKLTPV